MSLARGQTDAAPTSIMEPMDTFEFIRSVPTQLFVGGRFVPAENNATFPVADPATGKSLTDVADANGLLAEPPEELSPVPVSYTHLTLPTNREV